MPEHALCLNGGVPHFYFHDLPVREALIDYKNEGILASQVMSSSSLKPVRSLHVPR
jgi:hypothetical protein